MKSFLIIDGYNIINSWKEFEELKKTDLETARQKLIDMMLDYQGFVGDIVVIVFDAYLGSSRLRSEEQFGPVSVIYTKKGETADHYIEKLVYSLGKDYTVRVATSDRIEQQLVLGSGGIRLSARELREEILLITEQRNRNFIQTKEQKENKGGMLGDRIDKETAEMLEKWRNSK